MGITKKTYFIRVLWKNWTVVHGDNRVCKVGKWGVVPQNPKIILYLQVLFTLFSQYLFPDKFPHNPQSYPQCQGLVFLDMKIGCKHSFYFRRTTSVFWYNQLISPLPCHQFPYFFLGKEVPMGGFFIKIIQFSWNILIKPGFDDKVAKKIDIVIPLWKQRVFCGIVLGKFTIKLLGNNFI